MKKTIYYEDFRQAFRDYDRNPFSEEGYQALWSYFEELEESTGQEIELDAIAICCEYTEYKDFAELQANYAQITDMDDLKDYTQVIEIPDSESFIIQDF